MSDTLKVSMSQEDISNAFKWSRDAIASQAAEIERLRAHIKITQTRLIILRMQINSGYDFNENLASIDVLLNETRAALQPKEGEG